MPCLVSCFDFPVSKLDIFTFPFWYFPFMSPLVTRRFFLFTLRLLRDLKVEGEIKTFCLEFLFFVSKRYTKVCNVPFHTFSLGIYTSFLMF